MYDTKNVRMFLFAYLGFRNKLNNWSWCFFAFLWCFFLLNWLGEKRRGVRAHLASQLKYFAMCDLRYKQDSATLYLPEVHRCPDIWIFHGLVCPRRHCPTDTATIHFQTSFSHSSNPYVNDSAVAGFIGMTLTSATGSTGSTYTTQVRTGTAQMQIIRMEFSMRVFGSCIGLI